MTPAETRFRSFHAEMAEAIASIVRCNQLAIEGLTEKQVAEAIRQAFACGDFIKLTQVGSNSQNVIYIPFANASRLDAEIERLKALCYTHGINPNP